MKKTYYVIIIAILFVTVIAALYIHFYVTKKDDPKPGVPKSQSAVDLRPLIAAKMQQIVKDGSDSLYNLSMERLVPDVINGELDIYNATLTPDSAVLESLD